MPNEVGSGRRVRLETTPAADTALCVGYSSAPPTFIGIAFVGIDEVMGPLAPAVLRRRLALVSYFTFTCPQFQFSTWAGSTDWGWIWWTSFWLLTRRSDCQLRRLSIIRTFGVIPVLSNLQSKCPVKTISVASCECASWESRCGYHWARVWRLSCTFICIARSKNWCRYFSCFGFMFCTFWDVTPSVPHDVRRISGSPSLLYIPATSSRWRRWRRRSEQGEERWSDAFQRRFPVLEFKYLFMKPTKSTSKCWHDTLTALACDTRALYQFPGWMAGLRHLRRKELCIRFAPFRAGGS